MTLDMTDDSQLSADSVQMKMHCGQERRLDPKVGLP